jgi:hypothetical protein
MRASDQPSRLAQLGPSATGTGAATDSEIPEDQGRTNPETRRRSSEARIRHKEMTADHVGHSRERAE